MGEIADALRRARELEAVPAPDAGPAARSPVVEPRTPPARLQGEPEPEPAQQVTLSAEREGDWRARAVLVESNGPIAEQYRHFAIRLSRDLRERDARSILVTSATRSEGKTTTACNLVLALASVAGGRRIAFLECDLRRPSAAQSLGVKPRVGIEAVLAGRERLSAARIATDRGALDLYLAQRPTDDAISLLSGGGLPAVFRELHARYDLVVVDCPPVLPVPDVPLIQAHCDAALAVVRLGVSHRSAYRELLGLVDREKLIGVFVNEVRRHRTASYYEYYTAAEREPSAETGNA